MNIKHLYLPVILISIIACSCGDIFEADLTKEKITILAPVNNHKTNISTQSFWWEEIKGATHYNLHVVSPSFSSVYKVLLDTNITDNLFTYTFQPGEYQWRVKAENASSSSSYLTYSFTIDTTSKLSDQVVVMQTPANNSFSNKLSNSFSWLAIPNASVYDIQIVYNNFVSGTMVLDTTMSTNSFNYVFSNDSVFQWRVRARNAAGATEFSYPFNFIADVTPPSAPVLVSPNDQDTVTPSFTLNWTREAGSGTTVSDSLYIYSDSLSTLVKKVYKATVNHNDSLVPGDYFWRVRSQDEAGNIGNYSNARKFWIQ